MTPEQQAELERTSTMFHIALVELGAQSMQDALTLWQDVPPVTTDSAGRTTEKWLASAVSYVMNRRIRAKDLALAYYRYQRAVATGTTIAKPGEQPAEYVSIFELKQEFESLIHPSDTSNIDEPQAGSEDGEIDENDRILVEELDNLQAEMDEADRQAKMQIEDALQALGPDNMDRKIKAIEHETVDEVEAERQLAHKQAGNRQAATAAREVMNGARGSLYDLGTQDKRVLGYVRVSRTGTPCGWCAMLISRGFVAKSSMYRSSEGTGVNADGSITTYGDLDLYHDNCQCYAVPIYAREQLEGDFFALNRKYGELWPEVTKGLGGNAAISAWRLFIRNEAKSQKSQVAAA